VSLTALRDAAYLQATGDPKRALTLLESAWSAQPSSAALGAQLISALGRQHDVQGAREVFSAYPAETRPRQVVLAFAEVLERAGLHEELQQVLSRLPEDSEASLQVRAAILMRRINAEAIAHARFSLAGDAVLADPVATHEFAKCKLALASKQDFSVAEGAIVTDTQQRLLREAEALLERAIQLDSVATRRSWAYIDLAEVKERLGRPMSDVLAALDQARENAESVPALLRHIDTRQARLNPR
jgi:tetratricopeptide (TPR) repeat protein